MSLAATNDVRTYRVGPDFISKGNARANRKLIPIFVLLVAGGLIPTFLHPENRSDLRTLFVTLAIIGLITSFVIIRSLRRTRACIRKLADSFELHVSEFSTHANCCGYNRRYVAFH